MHQTLLWLSIYIQLCRCIYSERERASERWGGESVRTRKAVSGDPIHVAKWVPGRVYLDLRAAAANGEFLAAELQESCDSGGVMPLVMVLLMNPSSLLACFLPCSIPSLLPSWFSCAGGLWCLAHTNLLRVTSRDDFTAIYVRVRRADSWCKHLYSIDNNLGIIARSTQLGFIKW